MEEIRCFIRQGRANLCLSNGETFGAHQEEFTRVLTQRGQVGEVLYRNLGDGLVYRWKLCTEERSGVKEVICSRRAI